MFENSSETLNIFSKKGAFLTSGKTPNTMTVGWGAVGYMWKKEVLFIPVRSTRYTKKILDECNEFTVSVPNSTALSEELAYCGKVSGRDEDKFKKANLEKVKAKKLDTYTVGGCDFYYECKVIAKVEIKEEDMIPELLGNYPVKNFHTLYIGEIVDKYGK